MTEDVLAISAHKYGNYHKYYDFHPSNARTKVIMSVPLIFEQLWKAQGEPAVFSILDIGCNEGNLSMDILAAAKSQLPSHVKCTLLGVDVDRHLIRLANAKYSSQSTDGSICFETIDIMENESTAEYMDAYMGQRNMLSSSSDSGCGGGFSFVCLFSITMWVHLNHGDAGLKRFLDISTKYLSPRGNFLVEPQPWKCYKNAEKRTKRLGMDRPKYLSEITMKDIETVIPAYVMKSVPLIESYWCLGKEIWGRSIFIFHRNTLPTLIELTPAETLETATTAAEASAIVADGKVVAESSKPESVNDHRSTDNSTNADTSTSGDDSREHKKAKLK